MDCCLFFFKRATQKREVKLMLRKILLLLSIFFYCGIANSFAQQEGTVFPEQEPCGAFKVCSNQFRVPGRYGRWGETWFHQSGCVEWNVVWLKVHVATAGKIVYNYQQYNNNDTYNIKIFNWTGLSCESLNVCANIVSNPTYYNYMTDKYVMYDSISVSAGDELYFMVNNGAPVLGELPPPATIQSYGCLIDFTGSTALFYSESPPMLDSVQERCNNKSKLTLQLSKSVKCNSIAADGSDFETVPYFPIYTAEGVNCSVRPDGYTDRIRISFAENIEIPGTFEIKLKKGTDSNTIVDMCEQEAPLPQSLSFVIPRLRDTQDLLICTQQMPYNWNGITVQNTGDSVATFTMHNYLGCDSTTVLNLQTTDTMKDTVDIYTCGEMLPLVWNGITVNTPGMAVAQYHSFASGGCDSVTWLNVHAILPQNTHVNIKGCDSALYNNQTYFASSTFLDTVKNQAGCDSLYQTVSIQIYPAPTPIIINKDTANCGFIVLNDVVYTKDTLVIDTLKNTNGCDSAYINTQLIIAPNVQPLERDDTLKVCSNFEFYGRVYNTDTLVKTMLKNRAGCDSLLLRTFIDIEDLNLKLTANPEMPVNGDYVTLTTKAGFLDYQILSWQPQELFEHQNLKEQIFKIEAPILVQVVGQTVGSNCLDTANVQIAMETLIPEVQMPNAFSPNGDGINDVFAPVFANQSGHYVNLFQIYNRWGQLVYSDYQDKTPAWNGNFGNVGEPLQTGTYHYIIDLTFVNGKNIVLKGEVTLIR